MELSASLPRPAPLLRPVVGVSRRVDTRGSGGGDGGASGALVSAAVAGVLAGGGRGGGGGDALPPAGDTARICVGTARGLRRAIGGQEPASGVVSSARRASR